MLETNHIFEIGDSVRFDHEILKLGIENEGTISDIEIVHGNQYLTLTLECSFKLPAFCVSPMKDKIPVIRFPT